MKRVKTAGLRPLSGAKNSENRFKTALYAKNSGFFAPPLDVPRPLCYS